MNDKQRILTTLRKEFTSWEELLTTLDEEQITAPNLPSDMSIKEVIAHLRAWQQISIARMEAVLLDKEPDYPEWPTEDPDPDSEDEIDQINDWISKTYQDKPWSDVHRLWREGFLRLLELGEAVPERDLLDTGKYPWLKGYSPLGILQASYEHHDEHLTSLPDRLRHGGDSVRPEGA
jgi:hypothetical protein